MFLPAQILFFVVPDTVQAYGDILGKNFILSDMFQVFHLYFLLWFSVLNNIWER